MQCCGLFNYTDWRGNYPESCVCRPEEHLEPDVCRSVGYLVSDDIISLLTCLSADQSVSPLINEQ